MIQLFLVWVFLCSVSVGVPGIYYLYMKKLSRQPWRLNLNKEYLPRVSILVPTYNEADIIEFKLENLQRLNYPKELIQFIFIDSASTDNTAEKIREFEESNSEITMKLLEEEKREGKSRALNLALEHATGEVIVVSDADCFWPPDILRKALPYLSDSSVGAIVGREMLLNRDQTWVTRSESMYRDMVSDIRLGESKFHSTIFFEGGFSAYKSVVLKEFDCQTGADDSGTAFSVVEKEVRAVLIPEANFFTTFPSTWKGKIAIKIRRANQLMRIWGKCAALLLNKKLPLPKRIALPEIFLYLVNPLLFLTSLIATVFLVLLYPFLLLGILPVLFISRTRRVIFEVSQNNLILFMAFVALMVNRKFAIWKKAKESRQNLTRNLLMNYELI